MGKKIFLRDVFTGKLYVVDTETNQLSEYSESAGEIDITIDKLEDAKMNLEKVSNELSSEYNGFIEKINNDNIEEIYQYATRRLYLSRFEKVKDLSNSIRKVIERIAEFEPSIDLFTDDKKIILVNNIVNVCDGINCSVEITDYNSEDFIEMVVNFNNDIYKLRIEPTSYEVIKKNPILRELLNKDSMLKFLSKEKKERIITELIRRFQY